MLQSRPSMTRLWKRSRALLFSLLFLVSSFGPVSADVVAPNCSELKISPTTLQVSDSSISVVFDAAAGIVDDTGFRIFYTASGQQTDVFYKGNGVINYSFNFSMNDVKNGPQTIYLEDQTDQHQKYCQSTIIYDPVTNTAKIGDPGTGEPPTTFDLCKQAGESRSTCDQCLNDKKIWTGAGCIPFAVKTQTVRAFIVLGLGITGASVLLLSLYAGFLLSISQGNPTQVDEAKAAITSAVAGAFFIIFSVTILRFVGVSILQIPFFG